MAKTYLKWLASAKFCEDIGKEVSDESLMHQNGTILEDGSFIEFRRDKFCCITGREEIESENLFEVVDFLWFTHSMNS